MSTWIASTLSDQNDIKISGQRQAKKKLNTKSFDTFFQVTQKIYIYFYFIKQTYFKHNTQ